MSDKHATAMQNQAFASVWGANALTQFASHITGFALGVYAATILKVSSFEMGLLIAGQSLSYLAMSLVCGVWVDRLPPLRVLIWTELGRGGLLAAAASMLVRDRLHYDFLLATAVCFGILRVWFDVASATYLPLLLDSHRLVAANSRLSITTSVARILGPTLGGVLASAGGFLLAIAMNSAAFVLAAVMLNGVRRRDNNAARRHVSRSAWREMFEGVAFLMNDPRLAALAKRLVLWHCLTGMGQALFVLYATQELSMRVGMLGWILGAGGVGCVAGATIVSALTQRFGSGRVIVRIVLIASLTSALIPLARGSSTTVAVILAASQFLLGLCATVYEVSNVSLRQSLTPPHLLGRVNAATWFLSIGSAAVAAMASGALGQAIGLRPAFTYIVGAGIVLALLGAFDARVLALRTPSIDEVGTDSRVAPE